MSKWFPRKSKTSETIDLENDRLSVSYYTSQLMKNADKHLFYDENQDKIILSIKNKNLGNGGGFDIKIEKGTEQDIALRRYLIDKGMMPESAASTRVLTRKNIPRLITSLDLPDQVLAWNAFPLGQGDQGKDIVWDVRTAPHLLIVGHGEAGKSTIIRTILTHCLRHDWGIEGFDLSFIKDPTATCTRCFRNFPDPASTLDEALMKLAYLHTEMKEDLAYMKEHGEKYHLGRHKLIYLDNAQLLLLELQDHKLSDEEHELRSKISSIVSEFISDGPKVGYHVVVTTEHFSVASNEWIKSFPARIFLSSTSAYMSRVLTGGKTLARITGYIKGRACIDINGDIEEFQNYLFEPDYHKRTIDENSY